MPDTEENVWGHFLLSNFWSHEEIGCSLQKALRSLCQWVLICFLVNFSLNKKVFHVFFERLNVPFWGHLVNFPRFNFTGSQVFLEFSEVFWMGFGWTYGWFFSFFPNKWSTGVSKVKQKPMREASSWTAGTGGHRHQRGQERMKGGWGWGRSIPIPFSVSSALV